MMIQPTKIGNNWDLTNENGDLTNKNGDILAI
jgi:hypothetical protein